MNNIVTPTQGRKEFFKLIKQVNENKKPIIVKPIKNGEKSAVVIGEDDWNAIQKALDIEKKLKKSKFMERL